jgi:hypothetical protein
VALIAAVKARPAYWAPFVVVGEGAEKAAMQNLEELRFLAARGAEERKRFLDALEEAYGKELKVGNAKARRLLAELSKAHAVQPGTPLAKEFFERLLPLLPNADQQMFLDELLHGARTTAYERLDEVWTWWRRLWPRF